MNLSSQERDAILAGLRLLQVNLSDLASARGTSALAAINEIFTNGRAHRGLSTVEIDCLCEKVNS